MEVAITLYLPYKAFSDGEYRLHLESCSSNITKEQILIGNNIFAKLAVLNDGCEIKAVNNLKIGVFFRLCRRMVEI